MVLVELAAAGQMRQQFGVSRVGDDIGESIREAAFDALVQCGRLLLDVEGQQEAIPHLRHP